METLVARHERCRRRWSRAIDTFSRRPCDRLLRLAAARLVDYQDAAHATQLPSTAWPRQSDASRTLQASCA
jgi:hypothetical protein